MRPPKACFQCRLGKRRCDQSQRDTACDQCLQRDLQCSASASVAGQPLHDARIPLPKQESLFDKDAKYLVDLYFEFIHDKPHTLFHEPSFKASVADGTVSRRLLLSVMGLSARYGMLPSLDDSTHVSDTHS